MGKGLFGFDWAKGEIDVDAILHRHEERLRERASFGVTYAPLGVAAACAPLGTAIPDLELHDPWR